MLKKIPTTLKMGQLTVTQEYIDGFFKANNTFLYQLVYDPMKRQLVPLNDYPADVDPSEMSYAGPHPLHQSSFCSLAERDGVGTVLWSYVCVVVVVVEDPPPQPPRLGPPPGPDPPNLCWDPPTWARTPTWSGPA